MTQISYNGMRAAEYGREWALKRNPAYYDFELIGGDCTNFVSQCIFAGCGVMNYEKDVGWYYKNLDNRAAAWTGVEYLHNFLVNNTGEGPYGKDISLFEIDIGDVVQLGYDGKFFHTAIISDIIRSMPYVCAHTYDAFNRPLSEYSFGDLRFIKILGARKS